MLGDVPLHGEVEKDSSRIDIASYLVREATLIERDLLVAGDKLITVDTVSGLEWLDLSATNGQSYNAVAAGFGGYTTVHGFSFATTTQVDDLYENAGLANHSGFPTSGNVAPTQQLFALMGCTNNCTSNFPYSFAYADLPVFSATHAGYGYLILDLPQNLGSADAVELPARAKDSSQIDFSSYLVREPACGDGLDNDGEGLVDYPADPGCDSADDTSEKGAPISDLGLRTCDDGADNDGDGLTDYPDDPGCREPLSFSEDPPCDNWWDDDQDGLTDYPADPECATGWDTAEHKPGAQCGIGYELAVVMPLLWWLWERRRRKVGGPL